MELEVRIGRLGAQGDGIAEGPDGPLFVPFALPGELVSVIAAPGSDRAGLIEVLEPSPDRIAPLPAFRHLRRMRAPASRGGRLTRLDA